MSQADYDRGFAEGLKWVAATLRLAAKKVESAIYADFERRPTNGGEPKTFTAIAKTGQSHFASQLRAVADEIESAIKEAHSHGTQI